MFWEISLLAFQACLTVTKPADGTPGEELSLTSLWCSASRGSHAQLSASRKPPTHGGEQMGHGGSGVWREPGRRQGTQVQEVQKGGF